MDKTYIYKITLSFDTGALFAKAQEFLDEINTFMEEMMPGNGKLVARTNGFDMSLETGRVLETHEKTIVTGIILDAFEKCFPGGHWLVDSFVLVKTIN